MLPAITGDANLVFLWVVCVELSRLHQTETGQFQTFDILLHFVNNPLARTFLTGKLFLDTLLIRQSFKN
jgi:hypothetical protein